MSRVSTNKVAGLVPALRLRHLEINSVLEPYVSRLPSGGFAFRKMPLTVVERVRDMFAQSPARVDSSGNKVRRVEGETHGIKGNDIVRAMKSVSRFAS